MIYLPGDDAPLSQPRGLIPVDSSHPLARHLVAAMVPNAVVAGCESAFVAGTRACSLGMAGPLSMLLSREASDRIVSGPLTMVAGLVATGASAVAWELLGCYLGQTTTWYSDMDAVLANRNDTSNTINAFVRRNTDGVGSAVGTFSRIPGEVWYQEIVLANGVSGSGVLSESGRADITMARLGTAGAFATGKQRDFSASSASVVAAYAYLFATALTAQQRMSLRDKPGQLFVAPEVRRIWVPVANGGANVSGFTSVLDLSQISGSVSAGAVLSGATLPINLSFIAGAVSVAASVPGVTFPLNLSFIPGSVSAGVTVNGTTLVLDVSFVGGGAESGSTIVPGFTSALSLSFLPGTVSAGVTANGFLETLTLSFTGGAASGSGNTGGSLLTNTLALIQLALMLRRK